MGKFITMTFSSTPEIKKQLQQWAIQDERSISYLIRKAIEAEARRRAAQEEAREQQED